MCFLFINTPSAPYLYYDLQHPEVRWNCRICGNDNFSSVLFDLHDIDKTDSLPHGESIFSIDSIESISPVRTFRPGHQSTPTRLSKQKQLKDRPLRIVNINFRSIVNKVSETQNMIDSVQPDVIIGTETWLSKDIKDSEIFSSCYSVFRKDRDSRGGGVLIAVKDEFKSTLVSELDTDCEILWVQLVLQHKKHLYICAFYRPHVSDQESLNQLELSLQRGNLTKNPKMIICGDFNLPDWDWTDRTLKKPTSYPSLHNQFLELIDDLGMEQMVKQPTRDDNILDLVVTNTPHLIPRLEIMPGLGDHDIVYFEYNTKMSLNIRKPRPVPIYKKANWTKMREDMTKTDETIKEMTKDETTTTETLYSTFEQSIKLSMKENIPEKMLKKKEEYPWITQEIRNMIRRRDRLYRNWKKKKTDELKDQVKDERRKVQAILRRAQWDHVNGLFHQKDTDDDSSQKTKRFWTYLKHKKSTNSGVAPLKDQGQLITEPEAKAELLNNQFNSAFSVGTIYSDTEILEKCQMPLDDSHSPMSNIEITSAGVEKLLEKLDISKATGPDGVSPRILKTLSTEIAPILTTIFKHSMKSGCVPTSWKKANVSAIYKKGEHYKPSNYRPVSLTSVPCKVMEHIVVSHVMSHLETNNILKENQHGFRKKRSCETQLLELTDSLLSSLDKGLRTDMVVLDFAKAFDKVNHSLLTYKLQQYGVRGQTNKWIKDFLTDREQVVVVDGCRSSSIHVKSGVPQGSVLGPCLFLCYINDLPDKVTSNTRLFADDTAIDRIIRSEEDSAILQKDLDALSEWETKWDMSFHPDKCHVLVFDRSKEMIKTNYTLHGQTLGQVSSTKYLGITIQDNGEWQEHINIQAAKGNQLLGFLRRNLRVENITAKQQAFKMLIRPTLEYASTIWDPHHSTQVKQLEMIQRRAARFVVGDYRYTSSVDSMINTLDWDLLAERRKDIRQRMLHKILSNQVAVNAHPLIPKTTRPRRTHNYQLQLIPASKDYRKMSFFPRTVTEWNALPRDFLPTDLDSFFGRSQE